MTCSSLSRTSSILSKDPPPDKKPKSDKTSVSCNDFDPTGNVQLHWFSSSPLTRSVIVQQILVLISGLVQRCVIIQKDENGFGLTVSGDNPVFVQLVKEDGAAMRAGVQTGDRIIKVMPCAACVSLSKTVYCPLLTSQCSHTLLLC
uniref:PDZ domain-containing protein n=1 Tax=Periophthalmus magnuspinnatus TaxID=409849 RepID=A0A3B4A5G2_9GOBI